MTAPIYLSVTVADKAGLYSTLAMNRASISVMGSYAVTISQPVQRVYALWHIS